MPDSLNVLLAGFGGQGLLFAGKVMAYAGLADGRYVSWLPSYGPEMRGGTANCNVILSDTEIGSPQVLNPNVLFAMNLPSLEKFISQVEPGGGVLVDSSLISEKVSRTDVQNLYIPATKLADEAGFRQLGNIVLLGYLFRNRPFATENAVESAFCKCIPEKEPEMRANNLRAFRIGRQYGDVKVCRPF